MPRKVLVANLLCRFAYGNPAVPPKAVRGIGAEIPVFCEAKNAPKKQISKQTPLPAAYAKRYLQTLRHGVKSASGMPARSA
jgi:hypothetical protein